MHLTRLPVIIISVFAVATTAQTVLSTLQTINQDLNNLQSTLASWDGSLAAFYPILDLTELVLVDVNASLIVTQASPQLSEAEADAVLTTATDSARFICVIIGQLVVDKPLADKLQIVTPIISALLRRSAVATAAEAGAIIQVIPADTVSRAQDILTSISGCFSRALQLYVF